MHNARAADEPRAADECDEAQDDDDDGAVDEMSNVLEQAILSRRTAQQPRKSPRCGEGARAANGRGGGRGPHLPPRR